MPDQIRTLLPPPCRRPGRTASLSLCLLASFVLAAPAALAGAVAQQVQGQVEIGRGEPPRWKPLAEGESIDSEDRIRTGADGRVEIKMAAGTLRVHEDSVLRLPRPSADADRVDLERGHSLFDVLRREGRRFEVHTPTVVVSVKGTRFGVDASGEQGEVAVYRGVVGVRAAGIEHALETLVREGFLATGGRGAPIELDLAPEGDPWTRWQDFGREVREMRQAPARSSELERARAALHRATTGEVIERAAQRKPEIAERLRDMQKKRAAERRRGDANPDRAPRRDSVPTAPEPAQGTPIPASPDLPAGIPDSEGPDRLRRMQLENDMKGAMQQQRRNLIQERRRQQKVLREMTSVETMIGSAPLPSGETSLDTTALQQQQEQVMFDVLAARAQVEAIYMNSATNTPGFTGWTATDFMNAMTNALIGMGYDPATAGSIVDQVTGN